MSSRSEEGGRVPHSASLCGRAGFIGAGRQAAAAALVDTQIIVRNQFCAAGFTNQHDQVLCCYAASDRKQLLCFTVQCSGGSSVAGIMRTVERAFMSTLEQV